ncbi:MAG: nucleoside-diphosphate kinase [Candidatus Aenigmatarchaeota archaeon]
MRKTFGLVKPEVILRADEIIDYIQENGFSVIKEKKQVWTREQIATTYSPKNLKYPDPQKPIHSVNVKMSEYIVEKIYERFGTPIVDALLLTSQGNTVQDFVRLCGPTKAIDYVKKEFENTLRGKFGLPVSESLVTEIDGFVCSFDFNGIHKTSRKKELRDAKKNYLL